MERREDPAPRRHSHEPRAAWSCIAALGAVLLGAEAGAQPNVPPQFGSIPVTSADEDDSYHYDVVVVDPGISLGGSVFMSAPTLPAWLTLTYHGTDGFGTAEATLSGVPTQADVGNHDVVLEASDGEFTIQQSFVITVSNAPDPPAVVTPIPDQDGTEGTPFGPLDVAANFTDSDGDARSFSATGFPAGSGLSISAAGVISGTPTNAAAQASPFNVTVTATTGDGDVDDTFTFTVANVDNPPTVVTPIPNQSGTEGTSFGPLNVAANFTDIDGDARSFSATGFPAGSGLSVNAAGVISGTPTNAAAQASPFNVTVTAATSDGSVDDTFAFTVVDVDNPPTVVTPIPNQSGTQGTAFGPVSVAASFDDPDDDPLSFSATGFPASSGLSMSPAGVISGTPTNAAAQASPFNVTVTATATGRTVDDTFQFTVANVNDAPAAVADSYTTAEDTARNVAAPGVLGNDTDPDSGTSLTAVLDANVTNGTLTLNANGSFSYTPGANFNGSDSFTYHANDGSLSSSPVTVSITVTAVNDAPSTVADSYTTAEDTPLSVAAPGVLGNDTDPDSGATRTAVLDTNVSNGILALNANGSFSYSPNGNFAGTDSFTYHANDGSAAGNVATVTITVSNVDDAPLVTSSPPTAVNEDAAYSYTVTATDPDGEPLTFAAPTLPAWLSFNGTNTIAGTPQQADVGTHAVTMTVSAGAAPPVQHSFQIVVNSVDDAPVIASPIADQFATELAPFSLNLADFVSDADTQPGSLVYASTSALPAGLTLSPSGLLSGTPALAISIGDFAVSFTVSDGPNAVPVAQPFRLTVLRAGRADLALSLAAGPNPVPLNTTATWTFTISNNAPQVAVGAISLQALFAGEVPFQFDTPVAGCTFTPSGNQTQMSCTLGGLAGGATTSAAFTGRGSFVGDVFATASVAVAGPVPIDETPHNDAASASLGVAQNVSTTPAQAIASINARAAAAGDLNGDGFTDLALATGAGESTSVLLNIVDPSNANKRTLASVPVTLGDQGTGNGIALADLDGDSDLDIVTAMGPGGGNGIFLNSGTATFTASTLGDPAEDSRAVAAGDINGDLLIDLVFANAGPSPVYVNQGAAGAMVLAALLGNAESRGVALVNLFGDPLPEVVFANADGDATVYGNTAGVLQLALTLPTGPATSVATADFNNDGRFDLVFGRSAGPAAAAAPSNPVWLNTSASTGSFFLSDELGAAPTTAVVTADINLDGAPDVLAINGTGGHQIYTNVAAASGAFALHPQQLGRAGAIAAAIGTFGVDARADVALVGPDGVAVFYNDGSGNLGSGDITAPTIGLIGEPLITLTVQDVYSDAGATATDTIDGDVTARIVVVNPVNPSVIGTYTVTYNATDLSGNSATPVTRTVRVQERQSTGGGGGGAFGLEFVLLLAFVTVISRLSSRRRLRSNAS